MANGARKDYKSKQVVLLKRANRSAGVQDYISQQKILCYVGFYLKIWKFFFFFFNTKCVIYCGIKING